MIKKNMKKIVCLAMTVVLAFSCFVPSLAGTYEDDANPVLIITGFSEYDLTNKTTGEKAWIPETKNIVSAVEAVLPALTTYIASDRTKADTDTLCDTLIPAVNELFDPIACLPNGDVKHDDVGLTVQFTESVAEYGLDAVTVSAACNNDIVKAACQAVGEDHVWVYGLDWRVDPMILADEINEWVEHIKDVTGHDKVSISGISMGGIVMASYLAKYGTDDISNITMMSAAYTGLEMVGQLFTGGVSVDEQGLYDIISQSIGKSTLSDVLSKTGIVEKIIPVLDDVLKHDSERIYTECLIPCFGYCTGLWSFVPDAYFKQAKQYMNARMNEGTDEDTEEFFARVNDYHNNVQLKIGDILNQAKADGVCVAIVSNYNFQMPPVTFASDYTGDQVIETFHTSGFATVAKQGETLGENYKRNAHVSQDKMIDASTCYLPDNTWFIKNQKHVQFSATNYDDNGTFYGWLLSAKEQYDIYSNDKYPQFMQYDSETCTLSRLSNMDGDLNGDFKVKLIDARMVLQGITEEITLDDNQRWAGDMNYDGNISLVDAKLILDTIVNA